MAVPFCILTRVVWVSVVLCPFCSFFKKDGCVLVPHCASFSLHFPVTLGSFPYTCRPFAYLLWRSICFNPVSSFVLFCFLIGCLSCCWLVRALPIFWEQVLYQIQVLQIRSSRLVFSLHFLCSVYWRTEVLPFPPHTHTSKKLLALSPEKF